MMLIYNVTTGVDKKIEQEWLIWMKEVHIPDVMKTKMFVGHKMYRVLASDDDETVSYAIQYQAQSIHQIEKYLETFAPALREDVKKKFGEGAVSFRTLLEEVG
jgi:DNA-directed RNA polymerase beta' subunit